MSSTTSQKECFREGTKKSEKVFERVSKEKCHNLFPFASFGIISYFKRCLLSVARRSNPRDRSQRHKKQIPQFLCKPYAQLL